MDKDTVLRMSYGIPGMLWPIEASWLYDAFVNSVEHLEIGSYCGRSTFVTAAGMTTKNGRLIQCVDNLSEAVVTANWQRRVFEATQDVIKNQFDITVYWQQRSSVEAYRDVARTKQQFDSVFIDANHHYAECKVDIETWSTLVRPGGLIVGHDYWPEHIGVMEAVNETGPFEVVPDTRLWYRKVE